MGLALQNEEEWRAWLYKQALRYTSCAETAEDWAQETLLAFWQRFGLLPWEQIRHEEEHSQRKRWCCQKLRWVALDTYKRAYRRHELLILEEVRPEVWLAGAEVEADCLERLAIEAFVQSLPPYLQRIAVLYNAGYRYREIAEQVGVSVGTVQGYLGRIAVLGREFFGVLDNKSVVGIVNSIECPDKDISNRLKEVKADETTEGVIVECSSAPNSQSLGVPPHPFSSPDCAGGGGKAYLNEKLCTPCSAKGMPTNVSQVKQLLAQSKQATNLALTSSRSNENPSARNDEIRPMSGNQECIDLSQCATPPYTERQFRCRGLTIWEWLFGWYCDRTNKYYEQERWKYKWKCSYKGGSTCYVVMCGEWRDTGLCCPQRKDGPECQGNSPLCPIPPCRGFPRLP